MPARHMSTTGRRRAEDADVPLRRLRHLCRALITLGLSVATLLPASETVQAQDLPAQPSSPAAVQPTPAAVEPTPAAQTAAAPAEFTAGAPHIHTIAQGLMGVE